MKSFIVLGMICLLSVSSATAQKYFTRDGKISFHSEASLEKIEANNNSATSVIDLATNAMEFAVLIKGFRFEKALMEEHFNENYMESTKFPKATFKGTFEGLTAANLKADGTYPVTVKGKLTIHGVTKDVTAKGQFQVKGGAVTANSSFKVLVADYGISIPAVVKDNISKEMLINVVCNYQEYMK